MNITLLKTLKDLVWDERGKSQQEDMIVTSKQLREEAKKWAKWCKSQTPLDVCIKYFKDIEFEAMKQGAQISSPTSYTLEKAKRRSQDMVGSYQWIMHFFGLSEEDLKE